MSRKPLNGDELADAVAGIVGVEIADRELLRRALTHASARGASAIDYQRLEFLGDRVLGLVVAEMVFAANPGAPEGELSLRLNALVNAETLAEIADQSGLSELIQAGSEVHRLAARKRVNLKADVTEALIAVIYLEHGLPAARAFIARHWEAHSKMPQAARRDAKTELQEWAHQQAAAVPDYAVEDRSGPDHDPLFRVRVALPGLPPAHGEGRSKREAEQAAAAAMLEREGVWPPQTEDAG